PATKTTKQPRPKSGAVVVQNSEITKTNHDPAPCLVFAAVDRSASNTASRRSTPLGGKEAVAASRTVADPSVSPSARRSRADPPSRSARGNGGRHRELAGRRACNRDRASGPISSGRPRPARSPSRRRAERGALNFGPRRRLLSIRTAPPAGLWIRRHSPPQQLRQVARSGFRARRITREPRCPGAILLCRETATPGPRASGPRRRRDLRQRLASGQGFGPVR
ncbi:hypothetical protein JOD31_003879, partial [Methylopila capsulata]|nr:hypothetical protein [Methylopila capsulata]